MTTNSSEAVWIFARTRTSAHKLGRPVGTRSSDRSQQDEAKKSVLMQEALGEAWV